MITVEKTIVINRPVEAVFAFNTAEGNYQKISPEVSEVIEHGPRNTVGSSWTEIRKFMGQDLRTTTELVEFVPNSRWIGKVIKGPVHYETTITYEAVPGGTKYTTRIVGEPKGFFKLAESAVASQLGKTLEASNQRLKELVEKT